jgi:stage V sporulation protein B
VAAVAAKIIGALFKIPLYRLLGTDGTAHFTKTYQIYTLLLAISYSGIPVALSRLISASHETGNTRQTAKYFRVALPAFSIVGAVTSLLMFIFAPQLADFMKDPQAILGIRVLSPAVLLCCAISVYEGFAQGHSDMLPTAIKQMLEVSSKLIVGMAAAIILLNGGFGTDIAAAGAIIGVVAGLLISFPVLMRYKRRRTLAETPHGDAKSASETLKAIFKVSIPITLGASFMSVLTLIDSRVVSARLETFLPHEVAIDKFGIFSQCQTLFNFPPSLISAITISIIPAISAAVAGKRHSEARGITESAMKLVCLFAMPAAVGLSVLATPLFGVFYGSDALTGDGGRILAILGAASFFVCAQLLTTAVLQANGFERVPMITFLIGGVVQIVLDYILVGNPSIGILGSPVGTLACYAAITILNMIIIAVRVPEKPRLIGAAAKVLLVSVVMGVATYAVYGIAGRAVSGILRLGIAVIAAVIVYFVLIVAARVITREDLRFVPKGEKLAKLLRLP